MSEEITIDPAIEKVSDFSDRVSPMMVKELRQGMRGISFVILFIAIQLVLGIYIFGASLSENYNNVGQEISRTIFFCISMAVLVVQPLRGLSAISSEIKENTIDLMVMTRLSAWRIAFGKWVSLMSQSALIVTAVAPYLILRYFLGGMNLFAELMVLFTILIAAAAITAIMVGLSSIPALILRGIVGLGACAAIVGFCGSSLMGSARDYRELLEFCSFTGFDGNGYVYLGVVVIALYIGWLALDFGASMIAPLAENRATFRRIVSAIFIVIAIFIFSYADADMSILFGLLLVIPISVISLTEHPFLVPTVTRPFVRKGFLGKLSAWFLLPGWVTGLNYTMLLFGILMGAHFLADYRLHGAEDAMFCFIATTFACLYFPLMLVRLFARKTPHIFTFYLGAVTLMAVLLFIFVFVGEQTRSYGIHTIFFWIPPEQYVLYALIDRYEPKVNMSMSALVGSAYITCFGYWLLCVLTGRTLWNHISQNMKVAQQINDEVNIPQKQED